jgi:hypothetical protein
MELKNKNTPVKPPAKSIDDAIQELLSEAGSLKTTDLFFALAKNFICVLNSNGSLEKISHSFVKASGYTSQELLSAPFADFIVGEFKLNKEFTAGYYFQTNFCCRSNRILKIRWRVIPDLCGENTFIIGWEKEN